MSRILTILSVCLLAVVLSTAGCIIEDVETQGPSDPVATTHLAGDQSVGIWKGTLTETFDASGTGEKSTVTTKYTITIEETGEVTVSCIETKQKNFSSSTSEVTMSGTVSKADNVYTIDVQLLGTYVLTLSADGKAELTTPNAKTCQLEKQTP